MIRMRLLAMVLFFLVLGASVAMAQESRGSIAGLASEPNADQQRRDCRQRHQLLRSEIHGTPSLPGD